VQREMMLERDRSRGSKNRRLGHYPTGRALWSAVALDTRITCITCITRTYYRVFVQALCMPRVLRTTNVQYRMNTCTEYSSIVYCAYGLYECSVLYFASCIVHCALCPERAEPHYSLHHPPHVAGEHCRPLPIRLRPSHPLPPHLFNLAEVCASSPAKAKSIAHSLTHSHSSGSWPGTRSLAHLRL